MLTTASGFDCVDVRVSRELADRHSLTGGGGGDARTGRRAPTHPREEGRRCRGGGGDHRGTWRGWCAAVLGSVSGRARELDVPGTRLRRGACRLTTPQ